MKQIASCHEDFALLGARHIIACGNPAIGERGRFSLCISGGRTPRPIFEKLAHPSFRDRIDWSKASSFWTDERCVPPDHPDSNYGAARDVLLNTVSPGAVWRMEGEGDPELAARAYEDCLRSAFDLSAEEAPVFDFLFLGFGADGHIASLFPGTAAVSERERLAVSVYAPKLDSWRLSLTLPVLRNAHRTLVIASGIEKRPVIERAWAAGPVAEPTPLDHFLHDNGRVDWLVDIDAAGPRPQSSR